MPAKKSHFSFLSSVGQIWWDAGYRWQILKHANRPIVVRAPQYPRQRDGTSGHVGRRIEDIIRSLVSTCLFCPLKKRDGLKTRRKDFCHDGATFLEIVPMEAVRRRASHWLLVSEPEQETGF